MNSSDLVQRIADHADAPKAQVKTIVDELFVAIGDAAACGMMYRLAGSERSK
jgi:nucleoid DNA-binding protein